MEFLTKHWEELTQWNLVSRGNTLIKESFWTTLMYPSLIMFINQCLFQCCNNNGKNSTVKPWYDDIYKSIFLLRWNQCGVTAKTLRGINIMIICTPWPDSYLNDCFEPIYCPHQQWCLQINAYYNYETTLEKKNWKTLR